MTRLMVRVGDAAEAAVAASAGAEVLEMRLATLRDADWVAARAVRAAFTGTLRVSLEEVALDDDLLAKIKDFGGAEWVMPDTSVPGTAATGEQPGFAAPILAARIAVGPDSAAAIARLPGLVRHVMIDSGKSARLFDAAGIAQLATLTEACRAADLPFGFAGGLEAPDIPRLLMLGPDVLGFDAAVRVNHEADGPLLPEAIEAIRDLIPREGAAWVADASEGVHDTIFVRDFIVAISIGAYRAEARARQRVRFSVEASVARRPGLPRDMRDVFSYDVILETIRVLAERAHVAFVETLAEEVAAALLNHAAIAAVIVQVEKLDVIDGAVGVRIARTRSAGVA